MKPVFTKILLAMIVLLSANNLQSQSIIFSKTFPLDTTVGARSILTKCDDGNILLTATYQRNHESMGSSILVVKTKTNGDVLWQSKIRRPDMAEVTDVFEANNGYYIISAATIKIGKYNNSVQTVSKFDNNGNLIYDNIDTTLKSSPYYPWFTKKTNDKLISCTTRNYGFTEYIVWLDYDFESNYINNNFIDSLKFPNLQSISYKNINLLSDGTIAYSVSTYLSDTTTPIFYRFYDNNKTKIKEFAINEGSISYAAPFLGTIFLTKNGDYILTGRTYDVSSGTINFIRRVDNDGKFIWEDSLKEGYCNFNKIIEDNNGNIIVAGSKFNKYDSTGVISMNYFSLLCYDNKGKTKFKSLWGDSTIDNSFNDVIINGNGSILIAGSLNKQPYLAQIDYNPTSVDEAKNEVNELDISPNPVYDYLTFHNPINYAGKHIEIFNLEGLKILDTKFQDNIDVSMLEKGVYLLKIDDKYQKFIKLK
jgi:hypothetical protein